jgi:2-oxoglutarate ferredoxin oxidoreductase subunit alpha
MADETVGHMTEKVVIPPEDEIVIKNRKKPKVSPSKYLPYKPDADWIAPMATWGDGYKIHITGLTHDHRGYPVMSDEIQAQMVERLVRKIKDNADKIIDFETMYMDDAEVAVVSYGISSRAAKRAVTDSRAEGIKAGLVKLNTVWPFPESFFRDLASRVKAMVMPEINLGQMSLELERCAAGKCLVKPVTHYGGSIHRPSNVLHAVEEVLKETK